MGPDRCGIDPDIVGMTGIPDYILDAKAEGKDLGEIIRLHKKTQLINMETYPNQQGSFEQNKILDFKTHQMNLEHNMPISANPSLNSNLPPIGLYGWRQQTYPLHQDSSNYRAHPCDYGPINTKPGDSQKFCGTSPSSRCRNFFRASLFLKFTNNLKYYYEG